MAKQYPADDLRVIPGVGENMRRHFFDIGIHSVQDLKGKDPEQLYVQMCLTAGCPVDRCVLYVFRLAVYYAEHETHEAQKLKWWNWKD